VDVSGLAPGPSAILRAPAGNSLINTVASCWLSHLRLSGETDPLLALNTAEAELVLEAVTIDEVLPGVSGIKASQGGLVLRGCDLSAGGEALQVSGGSVTASGCRLAHAHADSGAGTEHAVQVDGGELLLEACTLENLSPAGAALHFTANPTRARVLGCTLRKADGTYAVSADAACADALVVMCALNGAVHSNIGTAAGNTVDAGV
jgi:hypothetical protein